MYTSRLQTVILNLTQREQEGFFLFAQIRSQDHGKVKKMKGKNEVSLARNSRSKRFKKTFQRDIQLYLLCVPALIFVFIFNYGPMYGVQIAFRDFSAGKGIWGSPWVGLAHFRRFFNSPQFKTVLKNTLGISFYSLLAGFPFPIIIALLLNQTQNMRFKKTVQTVIYAPHFISVVVLCSMITLFLSPNTGIVNNMLAKLGFEKVFFMAKPELFYDIFVWSGIWQNTGWNTVIYIAALSAINPELYEAAKIDGATRFQTIINIDLPSILPTIVILFIMRTGRFMDVGFQKAFLLQNPLNITASEIISTYVYKVGLIDAQFSYSTAIGLFNTVVNIILILTVNGISRRLSETSLW